MRAGWSPKAPAPPCCATAPSWTSAAWTRRPRSATAAESPREGPRNPDWKNLRVEPIQLWRIDLNPPEPRQTELERWLCPEERARADRFIPPEIRRRFTCARGSLREVLAWSLGCRPHDLHFAYGEQGKPVLADQPELRFNLSHSGERALVGVSWQRELGVDLEHLRAGVDFRGLTARFFSEPERRALSEVPEPLFPREFLRVWTRKEAYLKARGTGLALPLADFAVPLGELPSPRELTWTRDRPEEAARWPIQEVPCEEGYVGALCAEGPEWHAEPVLPRFWAGPGVAVEMPNGCQDPWLRTP